MLKKTVILTALLALAAGAAGALDLTERSDRELKRDLRDVRRELRTLERYADDVADAGRSSNNADRSSAVTRVLDHMTDILHDREDLVGREHTIIRYGGEVETGLTDAAEVGTPIGNKETRRRLRRGTADDLSPEVLRLVRMRTVVVSAGLLERPAIEKQADSFERFRQKIEEFAEVLRIEENLIRAEMDRRRGIAVPDTLKRVPDMP